MTDFSEETKPILKQEGLSPTDFEFIIDKLAKVNWKLKRLIGLGVTWENLNPSIVRNIIDEYNAMEINIKTGEIIKRKDGVENVRTSISVSE